MDFYDTYDENGIFQTSEDEYDVHYKGLLHKVIRVWLYDDEGNIYFRVRKEDNKIDCINQTHILSSESIASCFDRAMFEKLGIHFPATSNFEQANIKKVKIHRLFSDNSEFTDYYFLCDYIGEFDKNSNFYLFSNDTAGIVRIGAKGILHILNTRTGEVVGYDVLTNFSEDKKRIISIDDIYDNGEEDTYTKFSTIANIVATISQKHQKEKKEQERMKKYAENRTEKEEDTFENFVSHADENDGTNIY